MKVKVFLLFSNNNTHDQQIKGESYIGTRQLVPVLKHGCCSQLIYSHMLLPVLILSLIHISEPTRPY